MTYKVSSGCCYSIKFHLVLVTKYRRKVINSQIKAKLQEIFTDLLVKWECELLEFNGEEDHVHLLIDCNPKICISTFVNNLKTVSSRLIRKEFKDYLSKFYWKPVFWTGAYFILVVAVLLLTRLKSMLKIKVLTVIHLPLTLRYSGSTLTGSDRISQSLIQTISPLR